MWHLMLIWLGRRYIGNRIAQLALETIFIFREVDAPHKL